MASRRLLAPYLIGVLLLGACRDPAPTTGTLVVNVSGLPSGANASVRVSGPNQFFQMVRGTMEIGNLEPGSYIVARDTVLVANTRYGVDSASVRDTVQIVAGARESAASAYVIASGSINLTITGLPPGVPADLRVIGTGVDQIVGVSTTLFGLRPGSYQIRADSMATVFGDRFLGLPLTQTVNITASTTPINVAVNYTLTSGNLSIVITGLPSSPPQSVRVTGPGYDFRIAQSMTLRGLYPGTYTITPSTVNGVCPNIYVPSEGIQTRDVGVGGTAEVGVNYTHSEALPANLNLKIDKVYLTQATQDAEGTIPILAGKSALLRVFGLANQCNSGTRPVVRVTLSTGGQFDIEAEEDSVRMEPLEGVLASTWDVVLPPAYVQTGMTVVAEIDATNLVAEANEDDNRYPPAGTASVDVRAAPLVALTFVPITQTVNNAPLTGDVTPQNAEQFLAFSRKVHPVGDYDVQFREPYTTTRGPIQSSTSWGQLLGDLNAVRTAEGSSRYYHGILKVSYSSGVAGIAYVGDPTRRTGITWDHLPSASRVMAHELGHNFGRFHTNCGGPLSVDTQYPYAGGSIGVFGWDPVEGL
ncbi:MAG: zinc-dependent metalloprotease family protein, partial [Gemmatimonadaceae bacterium]